jgi:hypothetical protein
MTGTVMVNAGSAPPTDTDPRPATGDAIPYGTLLALGIVLLVSTLLAARRFPRTG